MISYTDDLAAVHEDMLHGFFVGWPGGRRLHSTSRSCAVATGPWLPSTMRTTVWWAS